jgi:hypothetical protein
MTRLVWAMGWVGVAIWSLFCALAYGLFDLVGRGFMRNADSFSATPETVESIFNVFSVLHSFSTGAILVVWAAVSLAILAVPWVIDRMVGRSVRVAAGPPVHRTGPGAAFGTRPPPGNVIDLGQDQYSVTPRGGPASGTPPRIPPSP